MNSIAAGASAHDNDGIVRAGRLFDFIARDQADAAAEDEGVSDVAVVEINGAVDGGDAHAVAVIAHAGDYLLEDPPRVDNAFGQGFLIRIRDAEDVGVGDRFGGQSGAEDVPDDAADAGGASAIRFDGA